MEEEIRSRFDSRVFREAMERFGADPDRAEALDGFESFIYEFDRADGEYVLRISHSIRRSEDLIYGEVDFISHLARGGASVARAIVSGDGNLIEPIPDGRGGRFLATAFTRAPGTYLPQSKWTPSFIRTYGRTLGLIHRLSRTYGPGRPEWRRPDWDHPLMLDVERFLPAGDRRVREEYARVTEHLRSLPHGDPEAYGLIHQDAHGGNFYVDDASNLTLFDFDDCIYCWYVMDIAMVIFYAALGGGDPADLKDCFLPFFLRAYAGENRLDPRWLSEIPAFLKLREIDLYALIHRSMDVNDLSDPWCRRYMDGRRESISAGRPFLGFDFEALAPYLDG
jgi:Ser/Thr protein kinase RdoA (MazF antagonist)